ncbi:MAG TPA: hypothetical protein VFW33_02890 [Gemmataceae bacterium]|nr:hypothetical protein [Gemmataceae bacterium]
MSSDPGNDNLDALARRVAGDAFFLSHALTAYQDRHRLDDAALAAYLGCPVAVLPSLRLCRMPGVAPERVRERDVADICRRFGIDPHLLTRVLDDANRPPDGAARVAP